MKSNKPILLALSMLIIVTISCRLPTPNAPTPTPTATTIPVIGGNGGNGGSGGSGASGGSGGTGGGNSSGGGSELIIADTPAPTPSDYTGPYVVEKSENLGGETISGFACRLTDTFTVNFNTPKINFVNTYSPTSGSNGTWAYSYSFPSLGETHDASGTYTISRPGVDGKLLLTETGSDHVVFNGFDGKFPVNYSFKLNPAPMPNCP
jgi:hypothetical protein